MLFKNTATLTAVLSVLSAVEATPAGQHGRLHERATKCNGDNLLNRFKDARYSAAASSFCQTYINSVTYSVVTVSTDAALVSTPVTAFPTVYPTPLITTSYAETRLSSACSCVGVTQVTSVVTEYVASATPTPTVVEPVTIPVPAGPVALGCYSEGTTGRTLLVEHKSEAEQADMTVEKCASLCAGYTFYGVEYAGECYCGDAISNGGFKLADQTVCSLPCKGDASEFCGGYSALNLYGPAQDETLPTVPAFESLGCFDDNIRVLSQRYTSQMMTHDYCALTCTQAGYSIYGVEYSNECWCGNSLPEVTHQLLAESCNAPCVGDASQTCGGSSAIDVYRAISAV